MYEIAFYKDKNGREPVREFIDGLQESAATNKHDRIQAEKINYYINTLKQYGIRAGAPVVKHIEGKLWELRPLENRIFFFYWQDNQYLFLHYFVKKTQKTPQREIEQAKRNMKDFLERSDKK